MWRAKGLKIISSLIFLLVFFAHDILAMDPLYTQFSNVPLFYNPAFTGLYTGTRVRFASRVQNASPTAGFKGYHLSADIGDRNQPGSGGFGIMMNTDDEGIGFIKNFDLGVSFSARVPFNRYMIGQVGIKASWLQKRVNWDDFMFSEKLSELYGNLYDSGFIPSNNDVLNLPDFGIGGLVQFVNAKGCLSGTFGLSADHLFEPDESFSQTVKAPLARKYTAHADLVFSVRCPSGFNAKEDDALKLNPGVIFQNQGKVSAVQAGMNITNYGVYFGLWYKGLYSMENTHSVSVLGGYRYPFKENMSIKISYSYDMQVNGPHKKTSGVHEISLVLEFSGMHLFKNSGSSYRSLSQLEKYQSQLAYGGF